MANTVTWTPAGTRGPLQIMMCSLHGEYAYNPGRTYFEAGNGCGACTLQGDAPMMAELEDAPF